MINPLIPLFAATAIASIAPAAFATVTDNFGQYSVTYDESTPGFGSIGSFGSGGFSWNVSTNVKVESSGGAVGALFSLPSFLIAPNAGFVMSGPFSGFLGNLAYANFGSGSSTSGNVSGSVAFNGGAPIAINTPFVASPSSAFTGFYSATSTGNIGAFNTIAFSAGVLALQAVAPVNGFANIAAQPQNLLTISFTTAPIPEPETYLLLLAGIGLIGAIVRRRSMRGA